LKVTAFTVDHSVKPAFGYRVDYAGHSVVLSGHRYSENLIRFSQGTDVLIHDSRYGGLSGRRPPLARMKQKVIAHHTTPEQAGTIFSQVKPKLAVFSTSCRSMPRN
jgi:ribonuclease Z